MTSRTRIAEIGDSSVAVTLGRDFFSGNSRLTATTVAAASSSQTMPMIFGYGATVDLRWTASAGGYAATGYVIEAGSAPGLADLASLPVGNVTRFTTTAPPGVYYVRVRAVNARGTSLPSNEVVVRR